MNIYIVIAWHMLVVLGLASKALARHTSPEWAAMQDVAIKYDLVFGSLAILFITSIVGLHLRKVWGYQLAVSANVCLFLMSFGMVVISIFVFYPEASVFSILQASYITLLTSALSLIFLAWLLKPGVKNQYVPSNI